MSLTVDKNDPNLDKIKDNGQQESYVVLSDEERAKGYVRPIRDKYIHLGKRIEYERFESVRILDETEKTSENYYAEFRYKESESPLAGRYIKKQEYDDYIAMKSHTNGCGGETKMHNAIAETYARDPKFYGGTFCVHCKAHFPVNEFVWSNTNELVGS